MKAVEQAQVRFVFLALISCLLMDTGLLVCAVDLLEPPRKDPTTGSQTHQVRTPSSLTIPIPLDSALIVSRYLTFCLSIPYFCCMV